MSAEEEVPAGTERSSRRRITRVNPNIQISEITQPRSRQGREKPLNRSEIFNFHCEGEMKPSGSEETFRVSWDAKFDRPLEQLIYPSLQRFDNESFEKKRQQYRSLHGKNEYRPSALFKKETGDSGHVPEHFQDGLQLEFVPGGDALAENLLFLHPPKWSMRIERVSASLSLPHTHAQEEKEDMAAAPLSSPAHSALGLQSVKSHRSRRSRRSLEDEESDTVSYVPLAPLTRHASLEQEIDIEGERELRNRLRSKYSEKLQEDERLLKEQAKLNDPFNVAVIKAKRATPAQANVLPPILDAGDKLYGTLKTRSRGPGSVDKPFKLSDFTKEELAYGDQLKYLRTHVPKENGHLLDGLLYYRMFNQVHTAQREEQQALDEKKMSAFRKRAVPSRKFSTAFQQRVATRRHALASNVQEMHSLKNEEANMVTADDLDTLPPVEEINLQRTTRAYRSQLTGLRRSIEDEVEREQEQRRDLHTTLKYTIDGLQRAEQNKRLAQDQLLLSQLDAGVLPEQYIKPGEDPLSISVMLTKHSIGDVRGKCLGKSLAALDRLEAIGLSDNRLTSLSLPTIIENLNALSVKFIDLSFNEVFDKGAKALANHFGINGNVLRYLDVCNCGIRSEDVKVICNNLKIFPNHLIELYLAGNKVTGDGAAELCSYLSSRTCVLEVLDLSWNNIGEKGAFEFATALRNNSSLKKLNLAANGLNDLGGQHLADSIPEHTVIEEINLSQNGLKDGTCFVLSQVLQGHPSIRKLELNLNPLGEAGARSIFRTILRGLRCFVAMRDCSYPEDDSIYSHQFPSSLNPFVLDLSEPYKRAVMQELLLKLAGDPQHCCFEGLSYRDTSKGGGDGPFSLVVGRDGVCVKGSSEKYIVPKTGTLKFIFRQEMSAPLMEMRMSDSAFNVLQIIIENGRTETDKKMWLRLLCQDAYFTTSQIDSMIARFKKSNTIGEGGLTTLDILISTWKGLLDTENMFEFLYKHTDKSQRKDLVFAMALHRYKFNWCNPTGFWRLSLSDKVQRSIFLQIVAINNSEAEHSRLYSGRNDTSQNGNWFNFRNEKYTVNGQTSEMVIDKEFLRAIPSVGAIEFDYVSTSRPPPQLFAQQLQEMREHQRSPTILSRVSGSPTSTSGKFIPRAVSVSAKLLPPAREEEDDVENEEETRTGTTTHASASVDEGDVADSDAVRPSSLPSTISSSQKISSGKSSRAPSRPSTALANAPLAPLVRDVGLATDESFAEMMEMLGLSSRNKVSLENSMFVLMDLQLAVTKFYLTTDFVGRLLDTFEDHWELHARVIVAVFSRIVDLYNLDLILRTLDTRGQKEVLRRIGCLNLMNPLKIAYDYVFNLRFLDVRILVVTLMELASIESADNIIEDAATELPISTLYGSYTRTLNESRPETMKFTYADFGVRTKSVSWSQRRDLLKKFLVGTQPLDEGTFKVISWYKEMEAAGALTSGPIDLQYKSYQKSQKNNAARVAKNHKQIVSIMRSIKK